MVLPALAPRPLAPTWPNGMTQLPGHLEPLGAYRGPVNPWPAPVIRFSFPGVGLPAPKAVNLVTGVRTAPGNARRGK